MSRKRIKDILEGYADKVGYSFGTDVVPTALAGGIKFPAIFWNAPDAEWSESRARWRYASTIYIIAEAGARNITEVLDELEGHALGIHKSMQGDSRVFADTTFTAKPLTDFDNSTAHGIKVTLNIYYDGGC